MTLKIRRFFTFWGFGAHLMHAAGLLPSTFSIAVTVFLGSLVHTALWNKHYDLLIDLAFHYLPLALFAWAGSTEWRWDVLGAAMVAYLLGNDFDLRSIRDGYVYGR